MKKWALIGFILSLFITKFYAKVSFIESPVYYGEHFYGKTHSSVLGKYKLGGQKVWEIQDKESLSYDVVFNHLFILSKMQHLTVHNSHKGNMLWQQHIKQFSGINIHYPYVFYWHKTEVGCLDFESGQPLWTTQLVKPIKNIMACGYSGQVIVQHKASINLLESAEGKILSQAKLPYNASLLASWNNGFLYRSKNKLYRFDLQTKKSSILPILADTPACISQKYHYIYYDPQEKSLISYNIDLQQETWRLDSDEPLHALFLYNNVIFFQTGDGGFLLNALTGKMLETIQDKKKLLKQTELTGFILSKDHLYGLTSKGTLPPIKRLEDE